MKSVIPKLSNIKIGGDTIDLEYLLNTDFEDVREACEQLPAAMAWLGWQRGYAAERLIIADQSWKEAEARAYFDLRNGAFVEKGYGDKMTEEALKKAVLLDATVAKAAAEYGKAKRWIEVFNSTIDAISAKLDMVRTSEATRRRLIEMPPEALDKSAQTTNR